MMQGIKEYALAQTVSSVPTHKTYRSHLRTNPQQIFTVELIYFKSVHPRYKPLPTGGKKIEDRFLLLKEIFLNPSSRDQIVFVEAQKEGLRPLSSLAEGEANFGRKLPLILRMVRLVPMIFAYGLLHDFHPDKVMYDGKDNVFLGNFIKKKRLNIETSMIEKNINDTIKTLIGRRVETQQVTDIRFQIENDEVCWLKIENGQKKEDFQARKTIVFRFSPQRQTIMYDYLIDKCAAEDSFCTDLTYEQLEECGKLVFDLLIKGRKAVQQRQEQIVEMTDPVKNKAQSTTSPLEKTEGQTSYPQSLVGVVESNMIDRYGVPHMFQGMGILISEYLVITCAHNLFKRDGNDRYKLKKAEDLKFKLNGNKHDVKFYRKPIQYQENAGEKSIYDYALLKLEKPIHMRNYIKVVKDYNKEAGKILIKGKYKNNDKMMAGTVFSNSFRFEQGYIRFKCPPSIPPIISKAPASSVPSSPAAATMAGPTLQAPAQRRPDRGQLVDEPSCGFSGSPIILIAAETDNKAKYFFMVGIYFAKGKKDFLAVHFNDINISKFAQWENQMMHESNIFKCVFSYKTVLGMDRDFTILKKVLSKIKFNQEQTAYFKPIWNQVNPIKCPSRKEAEDMYINAGLISKKKRTISYYKQQQLPNNILLKMGSHYKEQRYNNVVFMYSIHTYLLWHIQWKLFPQQQGIYLVTNYIIKRLCNFFQLALPCKEETKAKEFLVFREQLKNQLFLIYSRHTQTYRNKTKIVTDLLKQMSKHINRIPLNNNFKRLLQISRLFALNILVNHEKEIKKLYYFPQLLMYTFIGKQWFGKLAQLDGRIEVYVRPVNTIISICLRRLQKQHPEDVEEVTHNFLWGVREYIGEQSVKQILRIVDQSQLNEEEKAQQDAQDEKVQKEYFTDWGWQLLIRNYKIEIVPES